MTVIGDAGKILSMNTLPPKGLITALVTPLNSKGEVDKESLGALIESIIPHSDGILIGAGTVGEWFLLKNNRRLELIRLALEIVSGKIDLFAGITGDNLDDTKENIKKIKKEVDRLDYRGRIFLFDCPLWYHRNRSLSNNYLELGKLTEYPFILYNNPALVREKKGSLMRGNIRTAILKELSLNDKIVGLEHAGDFSRGLNYLRAVRERRNFRVYDGSEASFLKCPGMSGVISAGANIFPEQWKGITKFSLTSYRKKDPDYCEVMWNIGEMLMEFREAYTSNPAAIIKYALKKQGRINDDAVAAGGKPLNPAEARNIDKLLDVCELKTKSQKQLLLNVKGVVEHAKDVLRLEAEAINGLIDRIDHNFSRAVELILENKGRVIVVGIGKSGHIGRKTAATLASTGTPAFFLHPAEAIHGDLGMVTGEDIILAISNSGETEEVLQLLPLIKEMGAKIIAFTGEVNSTLGKNSDVVIDISVDREACPLSLAPTASTTAALAMGDALAMALLDKRGFVRDELARLHPGGKLGKELRKKCVE